MNTETMITELNAVAEAHKNDTPYTCQTNITAMCRDIIPKLEQLAKYEAIGTVEECREARERQRGKKTIKDEYNHDCCPNCGWIVYQDEYGGRYLPHCENCGQAIDYLWIKEFMDRLIEIFGDGIFEDCHHFHAIMQSHAICIDLVDLLDGFVDIEEVFPKEDYYKR